MFNVFFGALLGTMIGIFGALGTIAYFLKKEIKKIKQLIEDANTFKITLKNEI